MTPHEERQHLSRERLQQILEVESVESLSVSKLFELFATEEPLQNHMPDAMCQMDPRDESIIIFNPSRATRPHDQTVPLIEPPDKTTCPICQGATTGVIDVAELSHGFTFINKNLFPILHTPEGIEPRYLTRALSPDTEVTHGMISYGVHLLQWTSNVHDLDWHNMLPEDCVVVMRRLAVLEETLLFGEDAAEIMPVSETWRDERHSHGYVSIIKNFGKLVGGSLAHGHQQIAYSNVMPQRFALNWHYQARHNEPFTACMLRDNPEPLTLMDYGPAVLVVPYFMKRPYNMMLILKDTDKQYLHELNDAEITAVAQGWQDAIRAMLTVMPQMDKDAAYNVITHNGPGAGLYFEFLPYMQETGGFEQLGLWVCHDKPENVARHLRKIMGNE